MPLEFFYNSKRTIGGVFFVLSGNFAGVYLIHEMKYVKIECLGHVAQGAGFQANKFFVAIRQKMCTRFWTLGEEKKNT